MGGEGAQQRQQSRAKTSKMIKFDKIKLFQQKQSQITQSLQSLITVSFNLCALQNISTRRSKYGDISTPMFIQ